MVYLRVAAYFNKVTFLIINLSLVLILMENTIVILKLI